MRLFSTILDAARNSVVTSAPIAVEAEGDLDIDVSIVGSSPEGLSATLLVNGQIVGTFATVVNGDQVSVQMVASPDYLDARHVVIDWQGTLTSWSVVTVADNASYVNPDVIYTDPFSFKVDENGQQYNPHPTYNQVLVRQGNIAGAPTHVISLATAPKEATDSTNRKIAVASFFDSNIHLLDTVTHKLLRTTKIEGKPFKAVRVPATPGSGTETFTWATVSDRANVVVIDDQGNTRLNVPVGAAPMGIAVSADGSEVWVANNGESSVTHLRWNGVTWTRQNVQVGSQPYDIVVGPNGDAYVTCTGSNQLFVVNKTTHATSSVSVGAAPRGVAVGSSGAWVAVSGEGRVVRVDNGAVAQSVDVGLVPYAVNVAESGNVIVSTFGGQEILEVNGSGVVRRQKTDRQAFGFVNSGVEVWELSMWAGTPSYIYKHDQDPDGFYLDDPLAVPRNRVIRSNISLIGKVNIPTPASVVPMLGATLIKNGQDVGTRTTVVANDTLQVEYTSPADPGVQYDLGMFVGPQNEYVTSTTALVDYTVDAFDFQSVTNASPDTDFTSNEVVVSGLESDDISVLASITRGTLILNDEALSVIETQVKNGDRLRIRMRSSTVASTPTFSTVLIGASEDVWSIFTAKEQGSTYYQPASDAGKTFFDIVPIERILPIVSTENNLVFQYNTQNMAASPVQYSLEGPGAQNGNVSSIYNYVIDAVNQKMIQLDLKDTNSPGVERVYELEGIPYGLAAGPMVANGQQPTRHYVSLYNKDRIQKIGTQTALYLQAGTRPMGIAVSNYNEMFVAGDDGFLSTFVYSEATAEFEFETLMGIPDAGRLVDLMFDDSTLFVTDVTTNQVHRLVAGFYAESIPVGHLPYSMTQSGTHVFTANFGSASISMFPKANGGANVRTVRLPAGASQPTGIAFDTARNRLFVTCPRQQRIYELEVTNLTVVAQYDTGRSVWGIQMDGTTLVAVSLWANALQALNIGAERGAPKSLVFPQKTDVDLTKLTTSNAVRITDYLVLPEHIWIEPFSEASIVKNGVDVGQDTFVSTNDTIALKLRSSEEYFSPKSISMYANGHSNNFIVRTTKDVFPDYTLFPTVQNVLPRNQVYSDTIEVTGLGADVTITAHVVLEYPDPLAVPQVWVNDVEEDPTSFEVKNGDLVRVAFYAYGLTWNGNKADLFLANDRDFVFARFQARSGYLDIAIRPPLHGIYSGHADGFIEYVGRQAREAEIDAEFLRTFAPQRLETVVIEAKVNSFKAVEIETKGFDARFANPSSTSGVQEFVTQEPRVAPLEVEIGYGPMIALNTTSTLESPDVISSRGGSSHLADFPRGEAVPTKGSSIVLGEGRDAVRANALKSLAFSTQPQAAGSSAWAMWDSVAEARSNDAHVYEFSTGARKANWDSSSSVKPEYQKSDLTSSTFINAEYAFNDASPFVQITARYVGRTPKRWIPATRTVVRVPATKRVAKAVQYKIAQRKSYVVRAAYARMTFRSTYKHAAQYGAMPARKPRPAGTSWASRKTRIRNTFSASMEQATVRKRYSKTSAAEFTAPVHRVFDGYTYSATEIRAYISEANAIAAGTSPAHPVVFAKQMVDKNWFWFTPGFIERVDCASDAMKVTVVRGYVQGG